MKNSLEIILGFISIIFLSSGMILNSANAQTKPDFFKNLIHDPEHYTLEETATDGKVCFRVDDQRSSNSEFHLFEKSVWA